MNRPDCSSRVHPKVVADLLDHASSSFTMDTYSDVVPSLRAGALRSSRLPSVARFGVNSRDVRSGTIGDDEQLAFAHAVVAAAGPFVTDSWGLGRSRQDCRTVEELRFPAWSSASWEFVVLHKTERLVRSDPFRSLHRRIVAVLERLGDVGTLGGDELRQVLSSRSVGK